MRRSALLAATTVAGAALIGSIAEGDRKSKGGGEYRPLGSDTSFTTVHTNTLGLEGLTADNRGNLYSPARNSAGACPIVRVPASGGAGRDRAAASRRPAAPPGSRSAADGRLYVTDGGDAEIHRLRPSAVEPTDRDRVRDRRPGRQRRRVRPAWRPVGQRRRDGARPGVADRRATARPMRSSACSRWPTTSTWRPGWRHRPRRARPAAGHGHDHRRPAPGRQHARLAAHRGQRARVRPRRHAVRRPTPRAARSGASISTGRGSVRQPDRLRHDVHAGHALS